MKKVSPVLLRLPDELKTSLESIADKEHWSFHQALIESVKLMIKSQNPPQS